MDIVQQSGGQDKGTEPESRALLCRRPASSALSFWDAGPLLPGSVSFLMRR